MRTITGKIADYYPNQAKYRNIDKHDEEQRQHIQQYAEDNGFTITYNVDYDQWANADDDDCYGEVNKGEPDTETYYDWVPLIYTGRGSTGYELTTEGNYDHYWHDPQWTGREREDYAKKLGMSKNNARLAAQQSMMDSAQLFCDLQFYAAELTITDDDTGEVIHDDLLSGIDDYDRACTCLYTDGEDPLKAMQEAVAEREEIELTTYNVLMHA